MSSRIPWIVPRLLDITMIVSQTCVTYNISDSKSFTFCSSTSKALQPTGGCEPQTQTPDNCYENHIQNKTNHFP